jgi:uncharacterized protein (TIGR00725 family)
MGRRTVIAVVGGASASDGVLSIAEQLGQAVVDAGARLANGGRSGVMEASARGAHSSRQYREGDVIGVLPGSDADSANPYIDIAIPTALQYARNVVLTGMADAVIAVGGGSGTLSEIALAWQQGKPIVLLDVGEGWSSELGPRALDDRRSDTLLVAQSPSQAVELATAAIQQGRPL